MLINVLYYMCKKTKEHIKRELQKLKELKKRLGVKFTAAGLMQMKGFENLKQEVAQKLVDELKEYVQIVLKQLNRLNVLDATNKTKE